MSREAKLDAMYGSGLTGDRLLPATAVVKQLQVAEVRGSAASETPGPPSGSQARCKEGVSR